MRSSLIKCLKSLPECIGLRKLLWPGLCSNPPLRLWEPKINLIIILIMYNWTELEFIGVFTPLSVISLITNLNDRSFSLKKISPSVKKKKKIFVIICPLTTHIKDYYTLLVQSIQCIIFVSKKRNLLLFVKM